jgi:carbon monoxide dehydrogenase subunit G
MEIAGEFRFGGAQEQIWELLNDEGVLARCTPGCERLTRIGEDRFTARLQMGLAAVKGTYDGTLQIIDKEPPSALTLRVEASGTTGFVAVTGKMALTASGDAETLVAYNWDVNVGGPIAMVGQRVLGGVARWIVGDFFTAAAKELATRRAGRPPGEGAGQ